MSAAARRPRKREFRYANHGNHGRHGRRSRWTPAFAGVTAYRFSARDIPIQGAEYGDVFGIAFANIRTVRRRINANERWLSGGRTQRRNGAARARKVRRFDAVCFNRVEKRGEQLLKEQPFARAASEDYAVDDPVARDGLEEIGRASCRERV